MAGRRALYAYLESQFDSASKKDALFVTRDTITSADGCETKTISESLPLYYRLLCEFTHTISIDLLLGTHAHLTLMCSKIRGK